jgi:hypothetical protein
LNFGRSLGVHPVMAGQNSTNFNYTSRENPAKTGVSPGNGSYERIHSSFSRFTIIFVAMARSVKMKRSSNDISDIVLLPLWTENIPVSFVVSFIQCMYKKN